MKKPNFFIIGAPKCGTTSMAEWLRTHPQIFMSDPKEPWFFNTDHKTEQALSLEQYLYLFSGAEEKHLAVGEASSVYLFSHVAVKNLMEFQPQAKLIVMLRNPVEMAASWHAQEVRGEVEHIRDFEQAWQVRNKRELLKMNGERGRYPVDIQFLNYEKICKLGEQVDRLLKTVDSKSVLFLIMDDLKSDPLKVYKHVLNFLNVPYDGRSNFSVYNQATRPKSRILRRGLDLVSAAKQRLGIKRGTGLLSSFHKANTASFSPTKEISEELRRKLVNVFREDVELLSRHLGRDFSGWLK